MGALEVEGNCYNWIQTVTGLMWWETKAMTSFSGVNTVCVDDAQHVILNTINTRWMIKQTYLIL